MQATFCFFRAGISQKVFDPLNQDCLKIVETWCPFFLDIIAFLYLFFNIEKLSYGKQINFVRHKVKNRNNIKIISQKAVLRGLKISLHFYCLLFSILYVKSNNLLR